MIFFFLLIINLFSEEKIDLKNKNYKKKKIINKKQILFVLNIILFFILFLLIFKTQNKTNANSIINKNNNKYKPKIYINAFTNFKNLVYNVKNFEITIAMNMANNEISKIIEKNLKEKKTITRIYNKYHKKYLLYEKRINCLNNDCEIISYDYDETSKPPVLINISTVNQNVNDSNYRRNSKTILKDESSQIIKKNLDEFEELLKKCDYRLN